jgi:hypothetical protein
MHNYFCPILREKFVEVAEMLGEFGGEKSAARRLQEIEELPDRLPPT